MPQNALSLLRFFPKLKFMLRSKEDLGEETEVNSKECLLNIQLQKGQL